jgi:hypothetical protein
LTDGLRAGAARAPLTGRGEWLALWGAGALYAAKVFSAAREAGWSALEWSRYPLFLPLGLLILCAANSRLRSKVLGWSVFSLAFVLFLVVMNAFIVQGGAVPAAPFWRELGLYAALGFTGLFQLRAGMNVLRPAQHERIKK